MMNFGRSNSCNCKKQENIKFLESLDPSKNVPFEVSYLRKERDKCLVYLKGCNNITNCKTLNSSGGLFDKADFFESFFCYLFPIFQYEDKKGYDIVNKMNYQKISCKSEKKFFKPKAKVVEFIIGNKRNDKNDITDDMEFDGVLFFQNTGNCGIAYCTRETVLQSPRKISGGQMKVRIEFDKLFWIVHPNENVKFKEDKIKIDKTENLIRKLKNSYIKTIIKKAMLERKSPRRMIKIIKKEIAK